MEVTDLIRLIETVSGSELTGFRYETDDVKLELTKKEDVRVVPAVTAGMMPAEAQTHAELRPGAESQTTGQIIKSPLVGTFYTAPAEGAEPFVSVGDSVKKGQVIAIVEAMKLMNEIESEYDGIIEEVLVENGEAVEYGQGLFRVR